MHDDFFLDDIDEDAIRRAEKLLMRIAAGYSGRYEPATFLQRARTRAPRIDEPALRSAFWSLIGDKKLRVQKERVVTAGG